MTESIIIDGVDVQYCEYYFPFKGENCLHHSLHCECKKNQNCYYKQLQRKIQECEKLNKTNQVLNRTIEHLRKEIQAYKHSEYEAEEKIKELVNKNKKLESQI